MPDLAGRVELWWSVEGGAVSDVRVLRNTTGSDGLAACLSDQLRAWEFEDVDDGELVWPFLVEPAQ